MIDRPKPLEDGTCQVCCPAKFRILKDGTLRHHLGPSRTPSRVQQRCDGAGELPLETLPVTADTLETIVRGIVRQAGQVAEYERATFISHRIVSKLGPRMRELQGRNAMLADAVIGAKELVFDEVPEELADHYSESLHELAEDLLKERPHMRGTPG
ncbi:hypothetical protein ACFQ6C_25940 [Streptomyces sp. NPDC056454]|uniref:hypothetical protein n=1 Tax=Streptomyces sp. NPDC056454 TaxID=3345823 RepID=UPI0036775FA0